jgi:GH25 family lysozyme M1 (1,4-beta-N-acetylmuramidase)
MAIDPLFVDVYAGDVNGKPVWDRLAADLRYHGAIVKATEGLGYNGAPWFAAQWKAIPQAGTRANRKLGADWFRGAYHFLKFNLDGAKQADYYLQTVQAAGGFELLDLWPIVDVELGAETNSNQHASAQQIIECTSAFAARATQVTGRAVMLYGAGAMFERGITSKMGCTWLWLPRYTATLPRVVYERIGWDAAHLALWQHCGDGESYLAGYPATSPIGPVDQSVLTLPGGLPSLSAQLWAEHP